MACRFRHEFFSVHSALAQQPTALHQVVGLQHKLAFFKQRGLEAFDLVQEGNQVQRNLAHQLELGAYAGQLAVRSVPHLHKLVFEVDVKLAAQKLTQLRMHKKVAGVFADKAAGVAGQQLGAQAFGPFGAGKVVTCQPGVEHAFLQAGAFGGGGVTFNFR